jgi:hypothetical protein
VSWFYDQLKKYLANFDGDISCNDLTVDGDVDGTAFGEWSTESVTLTPFGTTWTTTPTLQSCRYLKRGKTVWYTMSWTGARPAANTWYFLWTRPAGYTFYVTDYTVKNIGSGDGSIGSADYALGAICVSSTQGRLYLGNGTQWQAASTYNVRVTGKYETSD